MITRTRLRTIGGIALPIIGGMVSQNVVNLVDTAMVGSLGTTALAAVGVGTYATFLATSVVIGLSSGVQTMAARRIGEGRGAEAAVPLNGGLFLALLISLPLMAVAVAFSGDVFALLINDPEVIEQGVDYLDARLLGVLAVGLNFAYRGYWNGLRLAKVYLYTLLVMHLCNIGLNYILIFGHLGFPALGALGAGIASTVAEYLGFVIYSVLAFRMARGRGFLSRIPRRETLVTMLRLGVPSALREFLFAASLVVQMWIFGLMGTAQVAVSSVVINLFLVAYLPALGLGLATLTLVSEALGRKDLADARRWGWEASIVALAALGALGAVAVFFPDLIMSGFLHDPETLALARGPFIVMGLFVAATGVSLVLSNALLGAGAARLVMVLSVAPRWLISLPLTWWLGPYLGLGLTVVWTANFSVGLLQMILFALYWHGGSWERIKI
jgi:putative MATE family efflux protein